MENYQLLINYRVLEPLKAGLIAAITLDTWPKLIAQHKSGTIDLDVTGEGRVPVGDLFDADPFVHFLVVQIRLTGFESPNLSGAHRGPLEVLASDEKFQRIRRDIRGPITESPTPIREFAEETVGLLERFNVTMSGAIWLCTPEAAAK